MKERCKLAIVATHPIQYYAPWFASLARSPRLDVKVFYLLRPADGGLYDRGFQRVVRWDLALLDGYESEFVPNVSREAGTHRFFGLRNPSLARRVRAFAPDAVLLMGYNFWSLVRFIAAWRGAPLLFRGDSHRLVPDRTWRGALKSRLIAAIFRRFAAFLYVGQANRRYFTLHGVPPARLFHSPHAVDNERFLAHADGLRRDASAWRDELGIPERDVVVAFAGKLEEKKRPMALLHAFRELAPADATLLFIGNGPLEAALRAAAGDGKVRFAPFQNQSLMPRAYAACDVLVLPSRGPSETWGLAVNEAMCVGRPAIVSSHVGCAEDLVIPGVTGLVFDAASDAALRDALAQALASRERLAQWGAAAREHVKGFGYERATQGLLEALEATAGRPR